MKLKFFHVSEKAKYAASRVPSHWPSYLHNKCDVRTCDFPNPPQAADGIFNCQGYRQGNHCKGTYYVSPATAVSVVQDYRKKIMREEQAKRRAQKVAEIERHMAISRNIQMMRDEQAKWRAQKNAEIERQIAVKHQLDEEGRKLAAKELAAKYEENRKKKLKDTSTGSTPDDLPSSPYLTRKAAQRRRPPDTKPTNANAEQQHHASSSNQFRSLALYPPAVNHSCKAPVTQQHHNHLPRIQLQISSRSQASKSATEYPLPNISSISQRGVTVPKVDVSEQWVSNSPQYRHAEAQVHNYQHGKSQTWF